MRLNNFGVPEFKKLGRLLSHPGTGPMLDEYGLLHDDPSVSIHIDETSGQLNIRVGFHGLCIGLGVYHDSSPAIYYYDYIAHDEIYADMAIRAAIRDGFINKEKTSIKQLSEDLKRAVRIFKGA